ncbi:alpha/beta hydrolase [Pseudonocardia sp. CA-107938]|uniref:alpha/beta hydrolase n=1 Tax=Pseudonocardia sp. CA-107938 TaxID=3240021 RepID=UPI003D8E5650
MLIGTGLVVAVLAAGLIGLWAGQRALIYFPQTGSPIRPADDVLPGARDVTLRTADGLDLGAWFLPAGVTTVLVANGNAGDRSVRAPLAAALAARGLSVLLFDYRGYGGNPGTPTEEGLALDVRAAHRYLVDDLGVPPGRILYYGESLGAAVVTELATEHPPAGLLLRSPFTELADVGRAHYPFLPVGALLRERYPLAEGLRRISVPTTVVYGSADRMVPPALSRAVAAAAAGPVEVVEVPGADHNDLALLRGPELIGAVGALAERASGRR